MEAEQRAQLRDILWAAAFFAAGLAPGVPRGLGAGFCLACYVLAGREVLKEAVGNVRGGEVFDENFLMALATLGAFALGEYAEGAAVMLFYQVGELFQDCAVSWSRRSIAALVALRPDRAAVERGGGVEHVSPDEVCVGEVIAVNPGERVPIDGVIVSGTSALDTSALTGESLPRDAVPGDEVFSGCISLTGLLRVRTTRPFAESAVSRLLSLTEEASERKARTEDFITRFARWYTPLVVIAAAGLALIPPLLMGGAFPDWAYRALTFLVISCPCALVVSVPLTFFGGIGCASRSGVLVKGGNCLEALADTSVVIFDKTGTLTRGTFAVAEVRPEGMTRDELLELAALAESHSGHPVAVSIRRAWGRRPDAARVGEVTELAGLGVRAVTDGRTVLVGNKRLMEREGIPLRGAGSEAGTMAYVAVDGRYTGTIRVEDELKADATGAVQELRKVGVRRIVMLTGDADAAGQDVARRLGLDGAYTRLLPEDKVSRLEGMLRETEGKKLAFVGDGINDAPVLARADVGIAMGALGSDAAIEAADVVLMTDELLKVPLAVRIARRTLRVARENIVLAVGVKLGVLALGALGYTSLWGAVFADVGVCILAVLNALRALVLPSGR